MASKSVLIASVNRKHLRHPDVVKQLIEQEYLVQEIVLPDERLGVCSIEKQMQDQINGIDLIIVYISSDSSTNVCISALTQAAEKVGVRFVCIWLDDVAATQITGAVDSFSDAITPYIEDLSGVFSGEENPWELPDGSNPAKRRIKKHTCG